VTDPSSNHRPLIKNTQEALHKAITAALERKRKLGQYSVIWRDNKVVTQGDDAPKGKSQG
jgi:hypothetical protein